MRKYSIINLYTSRVESLGIFPGLPMGKAIRKKFQGLDVHIVYGKGYISVYNNENEYILLGIVCQDSCVFDILHLLKSMKNEEIERGMVTREMTWGIPRTSTIFCALPEEVENE